MKTHPHHLRLCRRGFLAGAAALSIGGKPQDAVAATADAFRFLLLGDLHFDKLEHHDMEWLRREKPNDVRQVENYSRITREVLPALFKESQRHLAADDMAMAVQIGDFVEGLAGTPELARRHCQDAVRFVREAKLGRPFVFVKGNHDVTGPGSQEAFDQDLLPFAAAEAGKPLPSSSFTTRHGNALFVWFDAYRPDLDWLEQALTGRKERHLFFVTHPPVVPYGARADWHLFAKPNQQAQRQRLLNLLGKHRAMVLCGHLHKYGTVVRNTPSGPFLQLDVISVIPQPDIRPKDEVSGVDAYGPDLVRLEPNFSPLTLEARKALLLAEKPFIRHYDYADAPGYAVIRVEKEAVHAELFQGLGNRRWKTVPLSELLARGV